MLFALNKRYCVNEKGSVAAADRFPVRVPELRATVEEVLGCPGTHPVQLQASLRRMEGMVAVVRGLAETKV